MRKTKLLCCALISSFFITPMSYVNANNVPYITTEISDEYTDIEELDEELVDQLVETLAIIDRANKMDYKGNIRKIDFQMLRKHFGNLEFINKLEKEFALSSSWANCMLSSLADFIGFNSFQKLYSYGLKKLLEKKLWKQAAILILRVVGRETIKTLFNVNGLVLLLIWYSVKCIF